MAHQPGKLFYKIGEVSRLAQIEPYILRYWESEFPVLSPRKSSGGQRVYQQKDLDLVLSIKKMLHEEGYTIAGARKKILEGGRSRVAGIKKEAREAENTEALESCIVAETRIIPSPNPVQEKINKLPQLSLPFFGREESAGIQDALVKFKAEIKEIIELVK
ncbi:MAG: MerR family transcriptional regulator [Nitrospirota bacterium]